MVEFNTAENEVSLFVLKKRLARFIDQGRFGHQHIGIPVGGFADQRSASLAHHLLNQKPNTPLIEVTMGGFCFSASHDIILAMTGADNTLKIDQKPHSLNTKHKVRAGLIVEIGYPKQGLINYLALDIDWNLNQWLDSVAPIDLINNPNPIFLNQELKIGLLKNDLYKLSSDFNTPFFAKVKNSTHLTEKFVRFRPGPEWNLFSQAEQNYFTTQTFTLAKEINSMGVRLNEVISNYEVKPNMKSSGIVPGIVQVNPSGQPMVLLRDAQTTGGYPRLACVVEEDLDIIAQKNTGQKIQFVRV